MTQEEKVFQSLKDAQGEWVNGRYFLRELYLSQYHRAIWNLENKMGIKIEHSDFSDEHGFKSYRLLPQQPSLFS